MTLTTTPDSSAVADYHRPSSRKDTLPTMAHYSNLRTYAGHREMVVHATEDMFGPSLSLRETDKHSNRYMVWQSRWEGGRGRQVHTLLTDAMSLREAKAWAATYLARTTGAS